MWLLIGFVGWSPHCAFIPFKLETKKMDEATEKGRFFSFLFCGGEEGGKGKF